MGACSVGGTRAARCFLSFLLAVLLGYDQSETSQERGTSAAYEVYEGHR